MGAREKLEEAKAKRNARDRARREARAQGEHAEDAPAQVEEEEATAVKGGGADIFKNQKGTPANVKAKELAKAKSKKKTEIFPTFFSQKGQKVIKLIVKPGKTVSTYIGNLHPKKHKAALEVMIKGWKAEGKWLAEHEAKEKCSQIQAEYAVKAKA